MPPQGCKKKYDSVSSAPKFGQVTKLDIVVAAVAAQCLDIAG